MTVTRINEFEAAAGKAEELFQFLMTLKDYIAASKGCELCEVLRKNDNDAVFVVIEKWDSKESHKQSIEAYPQEKMAEAMPLFGLPPKGAYYHN
ncbi:MAG: antibiotic biosynthesis monooxygenase [Gammaproteobacteria bacterium]|nr:antibiotic biosynthesis monooxygenase [Gammaproteobacteria bacterium]